MIDRIFPATSVSPAARVGAVARTANSKGPAAADAAPVGPAAKLVAAGPPVDLARIDRIKAKIRDGSYKPDPAGIAARMVDLDLSKAP